MRTCLVADGRRHATRGALPAVVAMACLFADAAIAADSAAARGGLVPAPVPRKTREELVREWDLNHDGTIDQGEAEVAASKMRRERAALRLNSGLDPVTGRPRGEPVEEPPPDDVDSTIEPDVPEDEPATDRDERPALPGTRVPRPQLPGRKSPEANPPSSTRAGTAGSRAAADLKRQPVTGGVRAGGLPARAGYGAGVPAAPLNAGKPITPRTRATMPPANQARGGLVPTPPTGNAAAPAAAPAPRPAPPPRGPGEMFDPY